MVWLNLYEYISGCLWQVVYIWVYIVVEPYVIWVSGDCIHPGAGSLQCHGLVVLHVLGQHGLV